MWQETSMFNLHNIVFRIKYYQYAACSVQRMLNIAIFLRFIERKETKRTKRTKSHIGPSRLLYLCRKKDSCFASDRRSSGTLNIEDWTLNIEHSCFASDRRSSGTLNIKGDGWRGDSKNNKKPSCVRTHVRIIFLLILLSPCHLVTL